MSAIKRLIPEVIKTGDYATCVMQIPKGVAGEIPLLLVMSNTHVETGREGWYGNKVQCVVMHDDGENVKVVGMRTVEMTNGQQEMALDVRQWLLTLGACGDMWIEQIECALSEMIPV